MFSNNLLHLFFEFVSTMTGKEERELADMMERKKVAVLRVQETTWKGQERWRLIQNVLLWCT